MRRKPNDSPVLDDHVPPAKHLAGDGRKLVDSEYVGANAPDSDPDEPVEPARQRR
jgi:hypothetical protein